MTGLRSTRSVGGALLSARVGTAAGDSVTEPARQPHMKEKQAMVLAKLAAFGFVFGLLATPSAGQTDVRVVEIPGGIDRHAINRELDAMRLTGAERDHWRSRLLRASRGVRGELAPGQMLIGEFKVEPDSPGVEQVQQHELTIEYTPNHEWIRAQVQYLHDDGDWHHVVDTLGSGGKLAASAGLLAGLSSTPWRILLLELGQDAALTYDLRLVRVSESVVLSGPARPGPDPGSTPDVSVSGVRQYQSDSIDSWWYISGTVRNNHRYPLDATVYAYVYDSNGALLIEDDDWVSGADLRQGEEGTFRIWLTGVDASTAAAAARFELAVTNDVTSGPDVEMSCGGCESRPWESDGDGTNRAPQASGSIPNQRLTVGGSSTRLNAARYFTDPDGDTLTYSARSSALSVVSASTSGSTVTLSPSGSGSATVTVTAQDPGGLTATQRISVTVSGGGGGSACRVGQLLNPGDYCTVDIPGVNVGTNRFEVRSDGRGCFGNICSSGSVNLSGFRASRVSGTSQWRIDALP